MTREMTRNQPALDFLASRRSVPPKLLTGPAPGHAQLTELLTLAARCPDHGMLVPWRFIVLEEPALRRLGAGIGRIGAGQGRDPAEIAKAQAVYATSPLAVAVVSAPQSPAKIPESEQILSAGAVCLSLLNAALAAGWAAGWVSGWASLDRPYLPPLLGLAGHEAIAGMIHIGTGPAQADRPRPDLAAITTWLAE